MTHAHNPQKAIITTPILIRAASDQPQPVIHALVLAKADCLSLRRCHSAKHNPTGEAIMPTMGVKNKPRYR